MIEADNLFAMAFVLSGLAFFGFWVDGTELGKKTSGVVWIILLGVLLSNTGVIPAKSQAYDFVGGVLMPMAIPLLLIKADLRRIFRESGRVMLGFGIAAVSTIIGAMLGEEAKVENIFERWVAAARANADLNDLQEGVNISPYQELKIAFDGYAEDEDEFEDLNMESYAVYIHKEAATVGFVFPEHDSTPWAIVQRPSDELCHFVWYDKENATYSGPALAESSENSEVPWVILEAVINKLSSRHSN